MAELEMITMPRKDLFDGIVALAGATAALDLFRQENTTVSAMCGVFDGDLPDDLSPSETVARGLLAASITGFQAGSGLTPQFDMNDVITGLRSDDGTFFSSNAMVRKANDASYDSGFDAGTGYGKAVGYGEGYDDGNEAGYLEAEKAAPGFFKATAVPALFGSLATLVLVGSLVLYRGFPFFAS